MFLRPIASTAWIIISVLASGCGKDSLSYPFPGALEPILAPSFEPPVNLRAPIGNIRFDLSLEPGLYRALAKDLYALRTLPLDRSQESEMKRVFGLSEWTPAALLRWLEYRVRVLLDFFTLQFVIPTPDVNMVAENLGTLIYYHALQSSRSPASIIINGIGRIRVTSPRSGIIRWGISPINEVVGDFQISKSLYRTSILFHEGRHSDAHSEHLGFSHVMCPEGHSFSGRYACDSSLNGAYTIQALFLKSTKNGCQYCSTQGKELLNLIYVDTLDRVLKIPEAEEWDDSPAPELY